MSAANYLSAIEGITSLLVLDSSETAQTSVRCRDLSAVSLASERDRQLWV
jgi:hypothetical protein